MYPKVFENLIESLKLLPGVGQKTAERYAFSIIKFDKDKLLELSESIKNINDQITTCPNCGCLCETNNCLNCSKENNFIDTICVVENQKNVFVFEKLGFNHIKYHVLGGLISPIDGINPEDITINKLLDRIQKENIKEIILALSPGIEGTTTTLYITKLLKNKNVKITKIAQGIPIGTNIEYLDSLTLEMALENRSEVA